MNLRQAVSHDAKKLFILEQELFKREDYPLSYSSFVYHIKNNMLFLAEENEEVLGYILVLVKRKKPKIYSLGIAQKHRKKGLGALLITHAIEVLQQKDFDTLNLEVRVDNTAAIELYKKFGFETTKISKQFYRDGCDAAIMELTLLASVNV